MIQIIGGGVVGLTTGLVLNLNGYNTKIYTRDVPYTQQSVGNSLVATNYAAASVKPSTVRDSESTSVSTLFERSLQCFDGLSQEKSFVSKETHYILYHSVQESYPDYTDVVDISTQIDSRFISRFPVVRDGFKFEYIFVEMPVYIPWLRERYIETGGEICTKEVNEFSSDQTVVNCTGYGARELVGDTSVIAKRGHLLRVRTSQSITYDSEPISYVYTDEDGKFVYGYSRDDCLLLGGSSDEMTPEYDTPEEWNSNISTEVETIDGVDIPRYIVSENREILSQFGIDIDDMSCEVQVGFRPFRRDGVRVEQDSDRSNVYHNYGHGGAGVTLSWGSAYKILRLLSAE